MFRFDLNKEPTMNGKLTFTDGDIVVRSLAFDGERIKGDDVYFEKEFETGLITSLSNIGTNANLKFQIPQGNYTSIRIDFEAEESNTEKIEVKGTFINDSGDLFPIIVQIERIEFYDKIIKNPDGQSNIDLISMIPKTAIIKLNPIFLFSTISANDLNSANLLTIDGVETILISSTSNQDLYEIIQDKVNSGIEITID